MAKFSIFVLMYITSFTYGLYIPSEEVQSQSAQSEDEFADIFNLWRDYKQKIVKEYNVPLSEDFNEFEAVELIPFLIKLCRLQRITDLDEEILTQVYGNLWQIIVQEAERSGHEDMNPFMKSLARTFDLAKYIQNEINVETKPVFDVDSKDHPAQRVLKTAAMLIHHSNKNDVARPVKVQRKVAKAPATFNLRIRNIPFNAIRSKRNVEINVEPEYNKKTVDDEEEYEEDEGDMVRGGGIQLMGGQDYLYDDSYDDEPSVNSQFGSFQDLFLIAEKNRLKKEKEETKLKKKPGHFF